MSAALRSKGCVAYATFDRACFSTNHVAPTPSRHRGQRRDRLYTASRSVYTHCDSKIRATEDLGMAHVFGDDEKESDFGYVYKVSGPCT